MNLGLIGANSNIGTELCFLLKNDIIVNICEDYNEYLNSDEN